MSISFDQKQLAAYFVCGTQDIPGQRLTTVLKRALAAGITAFQYRDKGASRLTSSERLALGEALHTLCAAAGVPFIVDDDVDLALSLGADGIHVGQSDTGIQQVVTAVSQQMFVGLSCSTLAEVRVANQVAGLAYLGSGPIFPTSSKADADPVVGLTNLQELVTASSRPIVAIGGITEDQLPTLAQTGVAGAAVISMLAQSNDYQRTVTAMRTVGWSMQ
ncbi:thiamine phosphate synthase [Lactiplantibacillus songbeiensis]|uniref:Thiamine-phosphate synthase n=1 Tax=Lactiplantibacillus songbeiensis TaxID=2559920 RepID=A0ABW4BYM9_9LACO|nr:thiamine phosphate synthase [Lactiplantibacillus songbeiensis]